MVYDPQTKKTENVCNVVINESVLYKDHYPHVDDEKFVIPELECTKCQQSASFTPLSQEGELSQEPKELDVHVQHDSPAYSELVSSDDSLSVHEFEMNVDWSDDESVQVQSCFVSSIESGYNVNGKDVPMFNQVPLTYSEATSPAHAAAWGPPIQAELDAMKKYNVWTIVPHTKEMRVIPLKWVFTVKENGKRKARLVVVGCRDKEVYVPKDTASPTPASTTIRWLLTVSVKYCWNVVQLDVVNAFLNGEADRVKYVSIPQGIETNSKNCVCKLNKSLYGLATAPMCWYRMFNAFMLSRTLHLH